MTSDKLSRLFWSDEMKKDTAPTRKWSAMTTRAPQSRFLLPDCSHWRQPFELREGLVVLASAWFDRPESANRNRGTQPEIALYLDPKWADSRLLVSPGFLPPLGLKKSPETRVILFPWSDYGVPSDVRLFVRTLKWILKEVRKATIVEVGCMGGHGRTGTTLACLLVLQGMTHSRAITRVRAGYCEEAIESRMQLDFIRSFAR